MLHNRRRKGKKNRRTRDTKLFDALAVSLKFNLLRTPTVLKVIYKGRECRQIIENLYPDREVYLGYYSRILQKLPQQRGKKSSISEISLNTTGI